MMGKFSSKRNKDFWNEFALTSKDNKFGASGGKHLVDIENQFIFDEIDPHSDFLPAIVKGVLSSVGKTEFVAVSLNERILNVMPTWLDSKGIHHFQVILPEQALRAGKNEIEILAVVKESGSISLKKEISLGN